MTARDRARIDLEDARDLIRREAAAVAHMADGLDERFAEAVEMIHDCRGSVVVSGVGKAGIVGQKISATLGSTGTPSHFLHPSEAIHGDLGRLRNEDIVIVLSHSGSSEEVVRLVELLKKLGNAIIGVTAGCDSPLGKHSDVTVCIGKIEEVCPLGLAPSASTTCMLALGDALALTVMKLRHFKREDYARYHPGGALGRQLVTVEQAAMFDRQQDLPWASAGATVGAALQQAESHTTLRHGCVLLVDEQGRLEGLFTDGDLRRGLRDVGPKLLETPVSELMTRAPTTVRPDTLAGEAMAIFHKGRIDEIPVVDDDGKCVGLIDVQDVLALRTMQ